MAILEPDGGGVGVVSIRHRAEDRQVDRHQPGTEEVVSLHRMAGRQLNQADDLVDEGLRRTLDSKPVRRQLGAFGFVVVSGRVVDRVVKPDRGVHQGPLVLAILTSFVGVILLLRPAVDQNQSFVAVIGLLSGLGAAFAYMQVMAMARLGEPEARTVFYFAVGTMLAGALGMLFLGVSSWTWKQALWMLPLGILASLGQLTMTKAYSMAAHHGGTLMVANLKYCGIVFAAI